MGFSNLFIYVNNDGGSDDNNGDSAHPVETADEAFNRLPSSWRMKAEIIFIPTGRDYLITSSAVNFGTPIGPNASPLVLRGDYITVREMTAVTSSMLGNDVVVTVPGRLVPDELTGHVLTRMSTDSGITFGPASSIRGNSYEPDSPNPIIHLQRTLGPIDAGETLAVQQPRVTLAPTQTLNLTSHDGRSPNLALIGIKIAPAPSAGLNLLNVRALCETCEFSFPRGGNIHSNSLIAGGFKPEDILPGMNAQRAQAGVFVYGPDAPTLQLLSVVRDGVLGGHLTLRNINVRVSQGGWLVPQSLEALRAPINIGVGGSAFGAWGTADNKARIRNVTGPDGDGLRVSNGGSVNCPLGPINLDISGCERDGVRLDMGSWASFGTPGGISGLTGSGNGGRGMNVRNASRAVVGQGTELRGGSGDVALDDVTVPGGWLKVSADNPAPGRTQSLVRCSLA